MALKVIYDSVDEIPEQYRELYSDNGGQYELTGVIGMKTQADIDRLTESLRKERSDHKETKDRLSRFGDLDADDVYSKLDRISELEAAAKGKLDEASIQEIVSTRLTSKIAPIERERDGLASKLTEAEEVINAYKQKERTTAIHTAVQKAYLDSGAENDYLEDVLLHADRVFDIDETGRVVTKDGVGVTPGVDPDVWITEMQPRRAKWWPETKGAGAKGSNGKGFANNPWAKGQENLTEQGRILREFGRDKAEQMAAAAGVTLNF